MTEDYCRRLALYAALIALLVIMILITAGVVLWATGRPAPSRWGIAILYVVFIGHLGAGVFLSVLRDWYMKEEPDPSKLGVPSGFMGLFERLIFTAVIGIMATLKSNDPATAVAAVVAAMAFWMTAKLLSGWNRVPYVSGQMTIKAAERKSDEMARGAMAALLTSVVNILFAVVAGLIASGHLDCFSVVSFLDPPYPVR